MILFIFHGQMWRYFGVVFVYFGYDEVIENNSANSCLDCSMKKFKVWGHDKGNQGRRRRPSYYSGLSRGRERKLSQR
jgi:hypothetical protein